MSHYQRAIPDSAYFNKMSLKVLYNSSLGKHGLKYYVTANFAFKSRTRSIFSRFPRTLYVRYRYIYRIGSSFLRECFRKINIDRTCVYQGSRYLRDSLCRRVSYNNKIPILPNTIDRPLLINSRRNLISLFVYLRVFKEFRYISQDKGN